LLKRRFAVLYRVKQLAVCRKGSVAVISALFMLVIAAAAAMAIDAGSFFYQKRRRQSATDLAAMAAAANIGKEQQATLATLAANGFPASALQKVEIGTYDSTKPLTPVNLRFTPQTNSTGNAVRLTTQITSAYIFGGIFQPSSANAATPPPCPSSDPPSSDPNCPSGGGATGGNLPGGGTGGTSGVKIRAQATAAQNPLASFAIGSRLLSVNGGLLNAVLGKLLGSQLSLSVMDYQALANANIDLFAFSNALATRANLTAVTYDQLLNANLKLPDILNAIVDTARANPNIGAGVPAALSAIAAAAPNTTTSIAPLISYGPYGTLNVGASGPISVAVSALDLVSAVAQIANGTHQIQVGLNVNLPPIATASLQLAIGERPVGTPFVAVGATGASVHTAQTRLLLTVQLLGSGQASLVNLPVYIELASGTAQLSSIQCTPGDVTTSTVTLGVTPAVIDAWIGNVSNVDFTNFSQAPNPGPATLLNVSGLATVSGKAHATITNLSATPVAFSYADILQSTKKTTSTVDYLSSLLANLIGGVQLQVNVLGLGLGLPSNLSQTVAQILASATSPLDQLLSQLLQTLGVGLGQADTWVSGVHCGTAVLVS
jgi:uncharacterized membrane protein